MNGDLDPTFLQSVSRYETLGRAKSYLRQLNSSRDPFEQLIFFSYKSRHLGTPDDDASYGRLLIVVPGNAERGLPSMNFSEPMARRVLAVIDQTKLGPGLSSASLDDRKRRFGSRFEGTLAASAMVCSSCHNPERLGALNWPMDKVLISSYVNGGKMPRGHRLKGADRRDLYAKLIREYFAIDKDRPGILKSWLLGRHP